MNTKRHDVRMSQFSNSMMMIKLNGKVCLYGLLSLVLLLLFSSCVSVVGVGGGSGSFVSTTVNGSTRESVDEAVKSVFREEGFTLIRQGANSYHFQKWGGRSTEIMYGSLLTEGVAIEPEVSVAATGPGAFAIHCDVFMREHSNHELLDSNWKVLRTGKMAYRGMMRDIKKRAEGR